LGFRAKTVKALIKVGYGCNENCTFCHTLEVRHIDGSTDEVHAKIDRAHALGHTMVVLSGGEPTIRPELLDWAKHIHALGMELGLVTNGLMLAYPELVADLLRLGLRYVYLSLHGGTAKVHNSLVRADTFDVALRALGNLSGRGLDLTINCVITKQNVAHLNGVVDRLQTLGSDVKLKLSMVQPKGGGVRHAEALIPTVTEVGAAIVDAFGHARSLGLDGRLYHDGVPLCLVPGYEDRYADLRTDQFATMVDIGEPDFFPVDSVDGVGRVQPAPCEGCALRGACPGLYAGYAATFGDGELRPRLGGERSNAFNYVFERVDEVAVSDDTCPILPGGISPWDRSRHLFVKNGARLARFVTRTTDFSDVQLREIKLTRGQIYLDMSQRGKAAIDDFARELLPLRESALCGPCPERAHCTRLFQPVPITDEPDWFTRDDQKVRELLATLRGVVLDIGCGDGPLGYDDLLASMVADGKIRYVGLDPDAAQLARLATRRPWAELRVGVAEDLSAAELAAVDHVLILRSWNHLTEPEALLGRLFEALKPGATVTVVDNLPFGLARTPAQAGRAERSSARREHLRNDGIDAVQKAVRHSPQWHIDHSLDVGPTTSDQWLVRFSRI